MTIKPDDQLSEHVAKQMLGNNWARRQWGCQYGRNRADPKKLARANDG